ncbi:MAG: carboxylating nicotinate-nucleotide diphosphorylase [Solirubrobacteraceae bacterium]
MWPNYVTPERLDHFINEALKEDVGSGDHSTLSTIDEHITKKAQLIIKEDCILAGVELANYIFKKVDDKLNISTFKKDGDLVKKGEIAFFVEGSARSILLSERLVLNCMQRMSGIATYTNYLNSFLKNTSCKLLDTRKTTPNFRLCEKWAVVIGGGINHRFGLYDMIMLKDNHIDYAGGIKNAVLNAKDYLIKNKLAIKIEVETRTINEVKEAIEANVDRIMLDNMAVDVMKEAVKIINKSCEIEASGGINENNIEAIAQTGIDFISIGALTHSAKNIDLSLKAFS